MKKLLHCESAPKHTPSLPELPPGAIACNKGNDTHKCSLTKYSATEHTAPHSERRLNQSHMIITSTEKDSPTATYPKRQAAVQKESSSRTSSCSGLLQLTCNNGDNKSSSLTTNFFRHRSRSLGTSL
ncbi:hypothetical protein M758_1G239800 [Ceratodon purpureus]|uniref:Uncharacterized protein n=1 Tax=Ceratodon purpureus TaxID=3225 RepID=A0A8T0JAQ4_CERPU|nr:hypothetical protein KC19_1G245100 [Ceratodon purpureus]KAG0631270.1 hypothetical protein M758_1G239800 [Ceratodon purpureus]